MKRREAWQLSRTVMIVELLRSGEPLDYGILFRKFYTPRIGKRSMDLVERSIRRILRIMKEKGYVTPYKGRYVPLNKPLPETEEEYQEFSKMLFGKKNRDRISRTLRAPFRRKAVVRGAVSIMFRGAPRKRDIWFWYDEINDDVMLDRYISLNQNSFGKGLHIHLTKNFFSVKRFKKIKAHLPLAEIHCSIYVWKKRIGERLKDIVKPLIQPSGGVRKWFRETYIAVASLLRNGGFSLGEVCRYLNSYGIRISVSGLLKYRWRWIAPLLRPG